MSIDTDMASENREDVTIGVAVFTLLVATIAVSLRIYTRKAIINKLGIDDFCAVVALLLVFGCDFAVAYNTNFGLGRHTMTVPQELIPRYLRTLYVSIVMYNASLMAIKMTFLSQYYRIFQRTSKPIFYSFVGTVVFVGCWVLSQLVIAIFTCDPISGYWDKTKDAKCISNHPFWEVNAAGNIITDVMIFILPIPVLESLNLPRRQRHILVGIFSLGLFTVCISLVRIRFLKQYDDFTWENVESSGWSMGELASGLTCACLPTLRPLVGRYAPWLSSQAGTTTAHSSHTVSGKDPERGRLGTGSSAGASSRAGAAKNWPLPMSSTPAAFVAYGMQRVDSGGDTSDGVFGLQTARSELGGVDSRLAPHATGASERSSLESRPAAGSSRRPSQGSVRWTQPVVQTEITTASPAHSPEPPETAIQVRHDVYQTEETARK